MAAGAAKARAPNFVCSNPLQAADPATAFRAEEQDGPGRRSGEVREDQGTDPGSRPPRRGSSSTASSEEHRRLLHGERLHGAAAPPRGWCECRGGCRVRSAGSRRRGGPDQQGA
ncbi:hypothetical protein EJB05_13045 [Eragrostis curvula]|uniref:Uncharacterized protein n=1 Tax=Eragrostis curvula TaxID=38414 RepID=A0A5J9VUP2_9POAL|nr:hypothetical protein EJB05_13045 [Eragrostis curvula]